MLSEGLKLAGVVVAITPEGGTSGLAGGIASAAPSRASPMLHAARGGASMRSPHRAISPAFQQGSGSPVGQRAARKPPALQSAVLDSPNPPPVWGKAVATPALGGVAGLFLVDRADPQATSSPNRDRFYYTCAHVSNLIYRLDRGLCVKLGFRDSWMKARTF